MEIIVSTIAVIVAASCLIAFVRQDLKESENPEESRESE
jgi:hypothetical protein